MIKIVVIDKNEPDLSTITTVLSSEDDFEIVSLGRDAYDALKLLDTLKPDVAIIDTNLETTDEIDITSLMKGHSPNTAILIFTFLEDENHIREAARNRISGYLLKSTDMDRLAYSIRRIHAGEFVITPRIAGKVFRMFSDLISTKRRTFPQPRKSGNTVIPENLSRTELKIMFFIADGDSNKKIAEKLGLKEGTVRNYVSSIMKKTGFSSRTQLAIYAQRHGIIN